jgi:hypothetical protein
MISSSTDIAARLLEKKVISEDQVLIATKEQERLKGTKTVSAILVEMGFISEGALGEILNENSGSNTFDLKSSIIDSRLVKKISKEFAIHNKLIAVACTENIVTIGMSDIFDIIALYRKSVL